MPWWLDAWTFHSINISILEADMGKKDQKYHCIAINHVILSLVIYYAFVTC